MRKARLDVGVIIQLRKSGTSVGANVNEGKSSRSRKEYAKFYEIALRSAREVIFWFKVIEKGYDYESNLFDSCKKEIVELKNVLSTIVIKLKEE
jgi:four helix bundle protein